MPRPHGLPICDSITETYKLLNARKKKFDLKYAKENRAGGCLAFARGPSKYIDEKPAPPFDDQVAAVEIGATQRGMKILQFAKSNGKFSKNFTDRMLLQNSVALSASWGVPLLVYSVEAAFIRRSEFLKMVGWMRERGVGIVSVSEPWIDTTGALGEATWKIIETVGNMWVNLSRKTMTRERKARYVRSPSGNKAELEKGTDVGVSEPGGGPARRPDRESAERGEQVLPSVGA